MVPRPGQAKGCAILLSNEKKRVVPKLGSLLVIFAERSRALPLPWCDQFLHVRFKTIGLRYHVELFT